MKKFERTPKAEPFAMLTRELIRSDAWRSANINVRRLVDFLLLQHMNHGGKENGQLKAPYRQLVDFGIGARLIAEHIREAEELGLVGCKRQGLKVASLYRLTWLHTHDGAPPTDEWRSYRNKELEPLTRPRNLPAKGDADRRSKIRNLPAKGDAGLPAEGDADGSNLPAEGDADTPKNLPAKGDALSISSYHGGTSDLSVAGGPAAAAAPAPTFAMDADGLDPPLFLDRRIRAASR